MRRFRLIGAAIALLLIPSALLAQVATPYIPTWHTTKFTSGLTNSYTPQSGYIFATLVGGGGQGGGGHSTGGAGGGGAPGMTIQDLMVPVTAGSALTVRVAAAVSAGGGIAGNGTDGDFSRITGATYPVPIANGGTGGLAGAVTNGGASGQGGGVGLSAYSGVLASVSGGAAGGTTGSTSAFPSLPFMNGTGSGSGAGTGGGGGGVSRSPTGTANIAGGTGIGGGAGGSTIYGQGSAGGNATAASIPPAAGNYGAGSGGGGQNATAGASAGGLVIIREFY